MLRRQKVKHVESYFPIRQRKDSSLFRSKLGPSNSSVRSGTATAPAVDFCSGTTTGIEWQLLLHFITAMEAEAVVFAVCCPLQLLQQEGDGVVDNTKHPGSAHDTERQMFQVKTSTGFKDTVDHSTPGN